MKNLKLTHLEKMKQEEMIGIYGGKRKTYIKFSGCHVCIGKCSDSDGTILRDKQGQHDANTSAN